MPALDLSQASLSRTGADQLRPMITTAQTERQFGTTGSKLLLTPGCEPARRPKTTRVDISGGVCVSVCLLNHDSGIEDLCFGCHTCLLLFMFLVAGNID